MPTYRNDTGRKITDGDRNYTEWLPGQQRTLNYHIPYKELGLTKVEGDETPDTSVFRDWHVELTAGEPITLELPYMEAFELSIYAESGTAYARIGDGEATYFIGGDESHFSPYSYSRCPYIEFESEEGAVLRVKQEERNTKNTLRKGKY